MTIERKNLGHKSKHLKKKILPEVINLESISIIYSKPANFIDSLSAIG